jgi:GntR family transcriptional regulator
LLQGERQKFLGEEWPRIYATIQRLGLNTKELLQAANGQSSPDPKKGPKNDAKKEER